MTAFTRSLTLATAKAARLKFTGTLATSISSLIAINGWHLLNTHPLLGLRFVLLKMILLWFVKHLHLQPPAACSAPFRGQGPSAAFLPSFLQPTFISLIPNFPASSRVILLPPNSGPSVSCHHILSTSALYPFLNSFTSPSESTPLVSNPPLPL